jgi:hypothetical protein
MEASQSVPDLVAAAREAAKDARPEALEAVAVDVFSAFEARMQHHFKRGPFSRKLRAVLLKEGQADLAGRLHQYYLAVNVLKHGKGASWRELLDAPSALIVVKPFDETTPEAALVDVTAPGFVEGLTATILDAYAFLEK